MLKLSLHNYIKIILKLNQKGKPGSPEHSMALFAVIARTWMLFANKSSSSIHYYLHQQRADFDEYRIILLCRRDLHAVHELEICHY